MSYLVSRFSPFKLSSNNASVSIVAGSSVTMTHHATGLCANNTSAVTSTTGRLLIANIRTSSDGIFNSYFNFDPVQTVSANCSGSEIRASGPGSAVGAELGAALAPASYTPKINVGGGVLSTQQMLSESWVLSL